MWARLHASTFKLSTHTRQTFNTPAPDLTPPCALLDQEWDIGIFHPPCTHLSVSGARHFAAKRESGVQQEALAFVGELFNAASKFSKGFALENPVSIISSKIRKPDQVIQPWQFGHGEQKATCLWLKGLPKLQPTNIVEGREQRIWKMPPGPNRWKERSRTFQGIADAMASQWGKSNLQIQIPFQ